MNELLDGVLYEKPCPLINHARISRNISKIFGSCCCSVKIYLDEKNEPAPDAVIIRDKEITKKPDLVVEILSPSTLKRDRGYKKDLYERHGIKEYWIVDDEKLSIEVYWFESGKYLLHNIFVILPDYEAANMTEEQLAEYPTQFKTSLFDDLTIDLKDVFVDVYENVLMRC